MDKEELPAASPTWRKCKTFGRISGVSIGVLLLVGLLACAGGAEEPAGGDSGTSNSLSSATTIPAPTGAPSDEDLCIENPGCRLDAGTDELRSRLGGLTFNFDFTSYTREDGYRIHQAYKDPPFGVVVEWLDHEGVVWIWVSGPEPAIVAELDRSFTSPWSSMIRHITSLAAPGPWETDIPFWVMTTYSDHRIVNDVLIEVDYLPELQLSTIKFRKAP